MMLSWPLCISLLQTGGVNCSCRNLLWLVQGSIGKIATATVLVLLVPILKLRQANQHEAMGHSSSKSSFEMSKSCWCFWYLGGRLQCGGASTVFNKQFVFFLFVLVGNASKIQMKTPQDVLGFGTHKCRREPPRHQSSQQILEQILGQPMTSG